MFQDFAPLVYDSGNYAPMLEETLKLIDYERFVEEEQPKARAEGRALGIGVVTYVEGTGIGPYEGARVQVQPSGKVTVATGIGTQGQGHYTVFAQIVADQVGVDVRDVEVVTGDTDPSTGAPARSRAAAPSSRATPSTRPPRTCVPGS